MRLGFQQILWLHVVAYLKQGCFLCQHCYNCCSYLYEWICEIPGVLLYFVLYGNWTYSTGRYVCSGIFFLLNLRLKLISILSSMHWIQYKFLFEYWHPKFLFFFCQLYWKELIKSCKSLLKPKLIFQHSSVSKIAL